MTQEQQRIERIVRYAEAVGWTTKGYQLYAVYSDSPRVRVWDASKSNYRYWNPLTDANDALELAEKLDVEFARRGSSCYWAHWRKDGRHGGSVRANTLTSAICAAVDAALDVAR